MRINHQVLNLALLLSLSRVGLGQTTPAPTREDSIKGQIWTATARRVWADEKLSAPLKSWATSSDFTKWVLTQKPDKTELGSLFGAVLERVGPGQPATPAQVAQAILAEVGQRKAHKTGALAKVNLQALQAELAAVAPVADNAAAGSTKPAATPGSDAGSTVVTAVPGAGGITALPADTARPPAPMQQAAPTFTSTPAEPRYFGLPPTMAGLVLLLAGGLLGVGLAKALGPSSRRRSRRPDPAASAEPDSTAIMSSQEYRKLQKQNQTLNTQLHRLRQELAELKQQLTGDPVAATVAAPAKGPKASPAATMAPPVPAELPSIEEQVGAPAEAPVAAPAATRYGPVQETPFLEERKIVDAPLPQLALMLTVNPRDPSQATFTLNPQVDQARLIGDGLTRLQKFFDYDPPLGGRISSVAAVRPGRLQRQDSGWQVVERARLAIS